VQCINSESIRGKVIPAQADIKWGHYPIGACFLKVGKVKKGRGVGGERIHAVVGGASSLPALKQGYLGLDGHSDPD